MAQTWALIIFFVAVGNNGVSVATLDGFTSRESCERAASVVSGDLTVGQRYRVLKSAKAVCVQK